MLCTWRQTRFSTLMMFTSQRPANLSRLVFNTASTYAGMAVRLAASLAFAGKHLRVFTNDPERLLALAGENAGLLTPDLLEIDPIFPPHLRFYAAHHKLNVFERFSREAWPNCFLDLDIVLSSEAEAVQRILEYPRAMEAWVYDISPQMFQTYSRSVVQRDLARLGSTNALPLWYGGEFILGIPSFFARLSEECKRLLPTYLSLSDSLQHASDESIVSVALNTLAPEFAIGEAGDAELVARYWSGPTLHIQPRYTVLRRRAFWHLPDMKWVLSCEALSRTPQRLMRAIRARQLLMAMRTARG